MPKNRQKYESTLSAGKQSGIQSPLFDNLYVLSVAQLAALLGKKPQTIRNWVAQGKVPFVRGRPVTFLGPSIAAWLKSKEVKPCQ